MKYYLLDVETTGVNPNYHEIIEISVLDFDSKKQISKQVKAQFPRRYDFASLKITGRKPEDLYKGAPKDKVITLVNEFFDDNLKSDQRCIIAFVAHFDRNFCHNAWKSVGEDFPADNWLDARSLAREIAKKQGIVKPKLSLENSLKIAGIEALPGAHTACGDTKNTDLLVQKAIENGIDLVDFIKSYPLKLKEVNQTHWSELIEFDEVDLDIPTTE